jgi:hypothetical protein
MGDNGNAGSCGGEQLCDRQPDAAGATENDGGLAG